MRTYTCAHLDAHPSDCLVHAHIIVKLKYVSETLSIIRAPQDDKCAYSDISNTRMLKVV